MIEDGFRRPREVLSAIARLSYPTYRDVSGSELVDELAGAGSDIDLRTLYNLLFRLRDDGGYVAFYARAHDVSKFEMIRLDSAGRQAVEGWPVSPGEVTRDDVESLLALLEARSDDPSTAPAEQAKARNAATALRDLGVSVVAELAAGWLRHLGVP